MRLSNSVWNRRFLVAGAFLTIFAAVLWKRPSPSNADPNPPLPSDKRESPLPNARRTVVVEIAGRTQCTPKGKAIIAPVPLHPVEEVLVAPGDRVKKGQVLVKIDSDEQQAEVRAKKAALENAGIALKEARRYREAVEKASHAIPDNTLHTARVAALKAEGDERIAKAALQSAEAELEHYTVVSPIDGVVSALDVHVGTVSRPGTSVWGEILDLTDIDVHCELSSEQADQIAIGQLGEVRSVKKKELFGIGKVIFIGFAAGKGGHLIPVTLRLPNPKWRVRAEIPVEVRILEKEERVP